MKTEEEILELSDKAATEQRRASIGEGRFQAAYLEGVRIALDWVLGQLDEDETPLSQ